MVSRLWFWAAAQGMSSPELPGVDNLVHVTAENAPLQENPAETLLHKQVTVARG